MTHTETIKIKYVNQPKGDAGPGSVKDDGGHLWTVWPDKLDLFEGKEGESFLVTYQSKEYRGKEQRTIIAAVPHKTLPRMNSGGPVALDVGFNRDIDIPVQALSKCVPHWFAEVMPGDTRGIVNILRTLELAWKEYKKPVIRPPAPQQHENAGVPFSDDMDDCIPY